MLIGFLAGMAWSAIIAFFFTCFGISMERSKNGKDE